MKDIILESLNKIRALESTVIVEALTPEEQKELDALAKELEPNMGRLPELDDLLLQHQKLSQAAPTSQAAQAAPATAASGQAAQPAAGGSSYKIKPGDTLSKIAKDNGTTVQAIMAANPQIKDANKIAAGATLTLPGSGGQSAQPAAQGGQSAQPAATGASSVNAQGQNVTMPDGTNPETGGRTQTTGAASIPQNADKKVPYWVNGTRYEWKQTRGGGGWQVTATPQDKLQWNSTRGRSMNAYTGPDDKFDQWLAAKRQGGGTQTAGGAGGASGQTAQPATSGQAAQPAGSQGSTTTSTQGGTTTTRTNSSTSVSGEIKMGKPVGPIQYNGKTVNPGDPEYATASQALMSQQARMQQARDQMRAPRGAPSTAPVQQGATSAQRADF